MLLAFQIILQLTLQQLPLQPYFHAATRGKILDLPVSKAHETTGVVSMLRTSPGVSQSGRRPTASSLRLSASLAHGSLLSISFQRLRFILMLITMLSTIAAVLAYIVVS